MLLGAVDLGSNSFRVEIGRVEGDRIVTQSYWKETVRLAGGFDEHGALTPEIQARALATLARFNERLQGLPKHQVRAVGTQALRAATNSKEFLEKAEQVLGYKIELLSGHEEARLVFKGCANTLPPSEKRRLIVDIGGASTEFIVGRGLEPERCESYKIGCVNTSIRHFRDGRITPKSFEQAVTACEAEIEEGGRLFGPENYDEAFGSAGTFGAVSDICVALGWSDGAVTPEHLEKLTRMLLEAKDVRNIRFTGLKEDRREVIAGGLAVLTAVFRTLGIRSMRPASGALRVGLLYDLWGRFSDRDTREISVEALMKKALVDADQAERVSSTAVELCRRLAPETPDDDLKLLRWAALMHEVGMLISSSRYHRHGQYIISNTDMPGFAHSEQIRMATLVLAQRGTLKKLGAPSDWCVSWESVLAVRLAVILAHARVDVTLPVMKFERNGDELVVRIDPVWLNQHPLTDYLLNEESLNWSRIGRTVRFERFAIA